MTSTHGRERVFIMLRQQKMLRTAQRACVLVLLLPTYSLAALSPGLGADVHKAKDVTCADCHGKTKKPTFVTAERCLSCHGPFEALVRKTVEVKPENPHDSPHWGAQMECNVCHRQHEKAMNWCTQCHGPVTAAK